jgi:hypothetical protein
MNAKRRVKLEKIKADLMELIDAEEEAFTDHTEALIDSPQSQTLMETWDILQQAYDELEAI